MFRRYYIMYVSWRALIQSCSADLEGSMELTYSVTTTPFPACTTVHGLISYQAEADIISLI